MKLIVMIEDGVIIKDGLVVHFDVGQISMDLSAVWAISWDDALATPGEMQFNNGTHNLPFSSIETVQQFADLHSARVIELNQLPALEDYKDQAKLAMSNAAGEQILAGFESDALGTTHRYGGMQTDQLNLIGAVATDSAMPYPCADQFDDWQRRMHTASELKQVVVDGALFKQSVLVALDARRAEIDAAVDHAAVDAVTWLEV